MISKTWNATDNREIGVWRRRVQRFIFLNPRPRRSLINYYNISCNTNSNSGESNLRPQDYEPDVVTTRPFTHVIFQYINTALYFCETTWPLQTALFKEINTYFFILKLYTITGKSNTLPQTICHWGIPILRLGLKILQYLQ